jgi:cell fate regulator YaaT (PSP1 superfamily)
VDSCGLVLCCAAFLTDFKPISVREARNQGLQVTDSRLIGVCGLLKCCLMFEQSPPTILVQPTRSTQPVLPPS